MKNKMYTTPPRKPMMYGGTANTMSAPKMGQNTKMTMAASGMMYGGMAPKKKMAKGGMPMVEKDGKKIPAFAADGKGKMMYGGMADKKKK